MDKMKPMIAILAVAALTLIAAAAPAGAQTSRTAQVGEQILPVPGRAPPRIEIHPPRLLYRRCTDWYELQYRASGTVLYPQYRCWWVRG
jgi:hypothetical protein